jgi:hypothetical protein
LANNPDKQRAAFTMWGGVTDRGERMPNAHAAGPAGDNWHARRLFGADVDLDALTDEQWRQVAKARLAWLRANAIKAVRARQLKRAEAMRAKADALEARYGVGDE